MALGKRLRHRLHAFDATLRRDVERRPGLGHLQGEIAQRLEVRLPDLDLRHAARHPTTLLVEFVDQLYRGTHGIAVDDAIEQRRLLEHASRHGFAAQDHVERRLHTDEARQPLRATRAWQQA
jgi:hypothetical protein